MSSHPKVATFRLPTVLTINNNNLLTIFNQSTINFTRSSDTWYFPRPRRTSQRTSQQVLVTCPPHSTYWKCHLSLLQECLPQRPRTCPISAPGEPPAQVVNLVRRSAIVCRNPHEINTNRVIFWCVYHLICVAHFYPILS